MKISIAQPIWLSFWAMLVYAIVLAVIAIITLRIIILRKQRKVSDEKIHFFINTAHDIRTPLTLIKAPLEEIRERDKRWHQQHEYGTAKRKCPTASDHQPDQL